jgi:branched-subunit amino acid permease
MFQIIALIIFLVSFVGMGVIIYRKIPVLVALVPEKVKAASLDEIKEKIKRNGSFSIKKLLEKILSKFRVLTLKTEYKTNNLLVKLRQKSIEEKNKFSEDYWKKVKRKK